MLDRDVRGALHERLKDLHASEMSDTLFVDELGLCGQVRVDVAVVNGSLSGFELKSARDTLKRLPTQVEVYSKVLDYATLVVAENHALAASKLLPDWWGVVEARGSDAGTELSDVRAASMNPCLDPHALVQLLWRDEVLAELIDRDLADGYRSKPRLQLWQRLVEAIAIDELREVVRTRLKNRERWRVDSP